MVKVQLSRLAEADLNAIWKYIARDSITAADAIADEFNAKFALLASSPLIGRSVDSLISKLRVFPIGEYLIFYFPLADGVVINRVIHGARNILSEHLE